jgi:hypothetical protein
MRLFTTQRTGQISRVEQPVGVRLIILEDGALAFEPPKPTTDAALEVAVLVQAVGEAPADLEARVSRRLAQLQSSDRAVIEAVIAAGAAGGNDILAARSNLARRILAHMTAHGAGEIALAAGSDARPELRHELMALAEALTLEQADVYPSPVPSVGVRVLFGPPRVESERPSGIHSMLISPSASNAVVAALTG